MNTLGDTGPAATYTWTIDPSIAPSNGCEQDGETLAEGHIGPDGYMKLRTRSPEADQTWVCFAMTGGAGLHVGGRLEITGATAPEPGELLEVDDDYASCGTANGAEGPIVGGTIAGQAVLLETYSDSDETWVCARAGSGTASIGKRVIFAGVANGGSPPPIEFNPDGEGPVPPPANPGDSSLASSECRLDGGSGYTRLANMHADDTHLWVDASRPSNDVFELCTRFEGASLGLGGKLSIDASNPTGVLGAIVPTYEIADTDNFASCDAPALIDLTAPAILYVGHSAPGSGPATICVKAAKDGTVVQRRIRVGVTTGTFNPPVVWEPDPGTPGV